jgi:hypothetical protein
MVLLSVALCVGHIARLISRRYPSALAFRPPVNIQFCSFIAVGPRSQKES